MSEFPHENFPLYPWTDQAAANDFFRDGAIGTGGREGGVSEKDSSFGPDELSVRLDLGKETPDLWTEFDQLLKRADQAEQLFLGEQGCQAVELVPVSA